MAEDMAHTQPKTSTSAVLDPLVHLRRIGGTGPWGGGEPSGIGDLTFSAALALRFQDGTLLATIRVWNTVNHVEYEIPIEWDGSRAVKTSGPNGAMVYRRNLGPMPGLPTPWYGGLFYDVPTGLYFSSCQGNYDTSGDVMPCCCVGVESNGKLVKKKRLIYSIGDKRCSNVCRIPQWFADQYLGGGDWYGLLGGGGASAVNTGNVSLMPSICAFQLPEADGDVQVECIELQGSKYTSYMSGSKRQETTPMRWAEFGDTDPPYAGGWPSQPYLTDGAPGYWGWGHMVWAGFTWIDVPGLSGPLYYLAEPCPSAAQQTNQQPGCEYYGHNDGSDNPCSGNPGAVATLNSSAVRPVWYVTPWPALAEVAQGARDPSTVQSSRVEFTFSSSYVNPARGLPNNDRDGLGGSVAYDETRDAYLYGLMIYGGYKTDGTYNVWPTIQLYQVEAPDEPEPPEPTPEPPDETSTMLILDADGNEVATVTVKPPYTFG